MVWSRFKWVKRGLCDLNSAVSTITATRVIQLQSSLQSDWKVMLDFLRYTVFLQHHAQGFLASVYRECTLRNERHFTQKVRVVWSSIVEETCYAILSHLLYDVNFCKEKLSSLRSKSLWKGTKIVSKTNSGQTVWCVHQKKFKLSYLQLHFENGAHFWLTGVLLLCILMQHNRVLTSRYCKSLASTITFICFYTQRCKAWWMQKNFQIQVDNCL